MELSRRVFIGALGAAGGVWGEDAGLALWSPAVPMPKAGELRELRGVRFHSIKAHEPAVDGGYGFLHGVGLVWHKGKLYASFGHNKGIENTAGEEARGRVSTDGGRSWGPVFTFDAGARKAVSHGSFLSHKGKLWAFLGAFSGARERVHTRAYVLDERSGKWEFRGLAVEDGFWPMQEPLRMADGNWIMAGFKVGDGEPASVAVSRGDDFTKWDHVVIPRGPAVKTMWGESTVIVQGKRVLNIARYGAEAMALVSTSDDGGRTWAPMRVSNMPMVTSKPYAGMLSTGQRYLVATSTAGTGKRRAPLTIAVSGKGEDTFRRVYRIRGAEMAGGLDSHPRANLSYPYAVEYRGGLYVGYSNNGGRTGMNINSAELAVIPVRELAADS